jgi:ATP-binding cassette subfamily C protein CydCD
VLRNVAAALDARAELHANGVSAPVLAAIVSADRAATAAAQRSAWAEGLGQGLTVLACGAAALASGVLAAPLALSGAAEPAIVAVVVLLQLALVEPYAAITTAVRQYPALRTVLRRIGASGVLDAPGHEPDGHGSEGFESGGNEPGGNEPEGFKPEGHEPGGFEPEGQQPGGSGTGGLVPVPARPDGHPGIRLRALSTGWPGGPAVFTGLTATAEPGRWLAVTGASGSGKSTLLATLLGFLPVRSGELAVSGRAAWCPQEAHLFDSTIRGNLMLGLPPQPKDDRRDPPQGEQPQAQPEQQLQDALAAVGLGPLLARLNSNDGSGAATGLDTRIGPGGAYLSGGERQRLAVARTLLTGADVILLDEPTAHLDAESGRALLAELRQGLRDRTVVLVTHNPEDIDPADSRLDLDACRHLQGDVRGELDGAERGGAGDGTAAAGALLAPR